MRQLNYSLNKKNYPKKRKKCAADVFQSSGWYSWSKHSFEPGQIILLAQRPGLNWMSMLSKERAGDYVKLLRECDLWTMPRHSSVTRNVDKWWHSLTNSTPLLSSLRKQVCHQMFLSIHSEALGDTMRRPPFVLVMVMLWTCLCGLMTHEICRLR